MISLVVLKFIANGGSYFKIFYLKNIGSFFKHNCYTYLFNGLINLNPFLQANKTHSVLNHYVDVCYISYILKTHNHNYSAAAEAITGTARSPYNN